jgi:hypothetical protein
VVVRPTPAGVETAVRSSTYDVSPDGQRFLVIIPEVVASEQPLTAYVNIVSKSEGSK